MKATYRISEQDYVNSLKLFSRLSKRQTMVYSACAVALIVLTAISPPAVRVSIIAGTVGGLSVALVFRYVVSPILARRHYRKYKAIHEEFTLELVDEGIRFTSPDSSVIVKWDKILKWRQNGQYILIYPMPRLYHMIPKSIASQGFDLDILGDRLLQHVGKPI